MPRFNGTGPQGLGQGTGWGMGPCGAGMAYGRRGAGMGRGLGWRRFWGYYPSPAPSQKEEKELLAEEAAMLEQELKAVQSRLSQLKNKK